MDEKWSFVAQKEKNCDADDPEDQFRGDCWDHVAFDPLCGRPHNQDGLESAKPDLQSMFKKPGGGTAGPRLWGMLRYE